MRNILLVTILLTAFSLPALAQFKTEEIRPEDHFWRRKVVNRIDLNEKVNSPLIKRESSFYTGDNTPYAETDGLIMTLFNGLKQGKFVAFDPDSLEKPMSYDEVLQKIQEIEGSLEGEDDFDSGAEDDFGDGEDGEGFDDFDGDDEDDWGFGDDGDDGFGGDELGDSIDEVDASAFGGGDFDPAPFENVVHFIEDRIFDKTRSDMVYDIQLIDIIWTDPGETLPEKQLITFRYDDVRETLESAQWKNRYNDAEYKTLREVFELRLFHSYIIDISGEGIRSLHESEYRRQKMVEFEHHLWSY
ncbi:MAG: hypothetical protein AAFR87_13390 [Bacteroidota bacterium]